MKDQTRNLVARVILSSLIGSTLTESELREVARTFEGDRDLHRKITTVLLALSGQSARESLDQRDHGHWYKATERLRVLSEIESLVKRRRTSKQELIALLRAVDPGSLTEDTASSATARSLIHDFVERAHPTAMARLLELLGPDRPKDAYLEGLIDRE